MEEWKPHKQGQKYENEEDKRKGRLYALQKYNTKLYYCAACNTRITRNNKATHEKSKKHARNTLTLR